MLKVGRHGSVDVVEQHLGRGCTLSCGYGAAAVLVEDFRQLGGLVQLGQGFGAGCRLARREAASGETAGLG